MPKLLATICVVLSTRSSFKTLVVPLATIREPTPVTLMQPALGSLLLQGQPTPKQYGVAKSSHSSGTPLELLSCDAPKAMSSASSRPLPLQSGQPSARTRIREAEARRDE